MDILKEILEAVESEDRVMLATIVSTTGSTPAAALSKMLVKNGGIVSVGTVGGGCMEGEVLLHAGRLYASNRAEILTFHLNEDDSEHGLICGGSLDVLIEPVVRAERNAIAAMMSIRDEGEDAVLVTTLSPEGMIRSKRLFRVGRNSGAGHEMTASEVVGGFGSTDPTSPDLLELIGKTQRNGETRIVDDALVKTILEPIPGRPSLVVFGGGHVSKYVSRAAAMAGFRVTIVDDREQYANAERFPEAAETRVMDFSEAFDRLPLTPSQYLVIVTRGHKFDELLLERACRTAARYVGMIGSRRKVLTAFRHLLEKGVTMEELRRVQAPIGLDIGALTAEEIGISIVAQLIAVRRGHPGAAHPMAEVLGDLEAAR